MNWNPFAKPTRQEPEPQGLGPYAKVHIGMTFQATITVDRDMMGALDALVGYGDDAFLKAFKEKLGQSYIGPYEDGLKRFFSVIREEVIPAFNQVQQAERDLTDARRKRAEQKETR